MATDEHHILIANDWKCPIVLAGCYRKIKRHNKAEIYTKNTVKNCVWETATNKSWKLHVIVHGSHRNCPSCKKPHPPSYGVEYGFVPNISASDLADMVKESNLPNENGSKIRLDVCFSGMGGEHSLAYQLKKALGLKSKYIVSGVQGASVLGWGTKFSSVGTRQVIDPTNINQAGSKQELGNKAWSDAMANYSKSWWWAKTISKLAQRNTSSKNFKILSKLAHLLAEKTVEQFYREICSKGLVLDKNLKTYKVHW